MSESILAPFRYRDFRLLWSGLLISNLGTWMQFTAMGFFVSQIGHTPHRAALYLGFLGAARAIPVVLLSPLAGLAADKLPRRHVLFVANIVMALVALTLAVFITLGWMNILGLVMLSAINAAAQSFDSPTRQSWVPLMVDRHLVGNAIGLNSVAFNGPAVIGPAIAGLLIVWVGVAGSFYINAIATCAVVVAVALMKHAPPSSSAREPVLASLRQGIVFIVRHPILKWVIGTFVVTAITVRPYAILLPAFVVNTLHADARGLGIAIAAAGIGGFGGAIVTAFLGQRERRGTIWLAAGTVMALGVLSLGFIWNLWATLPVLFIIGLATLSFMGASNTLIQLLSPDDVRGRAVSVYTMVALGIVPGGSLVVGSIASIVGMHVGFAIAGSIALLMLAAMWFTKPVLRTV